MLKEKKNSIIDMVRQIFSTYEVFHGEPVSPPTEIVKNIIRVILSVCPECFHLKMKVTNKDICDQVLDRVVERMYKIAEKELKKRKEIEYIS